MPAARRARPRLRRCRAERTSAPSGALKILVGTAAVGKVIVSASPALVPALGGSSTVSAVVFDVNGNALVSAPVSFSTTAGMLSTSLATTDKAGHRANGPHDLDVSDGDGQCRRAGPTTTPPATGDPIDDADIGPGVGNRDSGRCGIADAADYPRATAPSAGLPAVFTFAVTVARNQRQPGSPGHRELGRPVGDSGPGCHHRKHECCPRLRIARHVFSDRHGDRQLRQRRQCVATSNCQPKTAADGFTDCYHDQSNCGYGRDLHWLPWRRRRAPAR